jgi:multicomponent Na+:H+ antiporter subunit A
LTTPGLTSATHYSWALALLLLGAFTKSAQFPFHFWLPGAMSAPTPASAYLHSATMVKAGVYLLARLHPALADDPRWFWTLLLAGGITMLAGAISAMGQYDIKALLAYATVSQLGILVMLLAFNSTEAVMAVAVGILAHALYKGPLFLLAGIVDHATGTRDLRRLGHLRRELPLVTAVVLFAGLSMAGVPPFFGFLAKETLLETFYHHAQTLASLTGWTGMVVAALAGAFFVAYSLTLLWEGFLRGHAAGDAVHVHHAPAFAFVLAPLLLTLIGTAIPYMLGPVGDQLLDAPASAIFGRTVEMHLALWHGWTPVVITSLAAIATGVLIFFARSALRAALRALPDALNGAAVFDKTVDLIQQLAVWVTRKIQGGTFAQQASITLAAAILALGYSLRALQWPLDFRALWGNSPSLAEFILAVLGGVAAIATVRAPTRLSAIISSGVVGVIITLFFIFFNAPDLALTQLLVDILTVVLLVLVFYRIPPQPPPPFRRLVQVRNLAVAIAVGALGFILTLFSAGASFAPAIGDWFSLNSVALGHGANIVNVILVDFRGFDTLGEITVLTVAGIGGYSILRSAFFRPRPFVRSEPSSESLPNDEYTHA